MPVSQQGTRFQEKELALILLQVIGENELSLWPPGAYISVGGKGEKHTNKQSSNGSGGDESTYLDLEWFPQFALSFRPQVKLPETRFFVNSFMEYNLHTIKCTIWEVLTELHTRETTTTNQIVIHRPQISLCPFATPLLLPFVPIRTDGWQPLISSLLLQITLHFLKFYRNEIILKSYFGFFHSPKLFWDSSLWSC